MEQELFSQLEEKLLNVSNIYQSLPAMGATEYKAALSRAKQECAEVNDQISQIAARDYPDRNWPDEFWRLKVAAFLLSTGYAKNYEIFIGRLAYSVLGKYQPINTPAMAESFKLVKAGAMLIVNEAFYLYAPGKYFHEIFAIIQAGIKAIRQEARFFLERNCPGFTDISLILDDYEEKLQGYQDSMPPENRQSFIEINHKMRAVSLPTAEDFNKEFTLAFNDFLYQTIACKVESWNLEFLKSSLEKFKRTITIIKDNFSFAYDPDLANFIETMQLACRQGVDQRSLQQLCQFYVGA